MKNFRMIAAALLFSTLTVSTVASAKGHHGPTYMTAQNAADANHRLQLIEQSLLDDGYKLADVSEQQINYIAAPQAPYNWGNLVYTYTRIVPGHFNLVHRVEVTTEVVSTTDGFSFPRITIHELLSQ